MTKTMTTTQAADIIDAIVRHADLTPREIAALRLLQSQAANELREMAADAWANIEGEPAVLASELIDRAGQLDP